MQIISDDDTNKDQSAVVYADHSHWWDNLFEKGSPFYAGLLVAETYDSNIFISQRAVGDFYTSVTPFVDFVKGDKDATNANYFNAYFRPTLFFYDRESQENRTNYSVGALYRHNWTRLSLSIQQQFEQVTDASIDVGNFFSRKIYATSLNANYEVNDKLTVGADASQRISTFVNQAISETDEWSANLYADYELTSKLTLGLVPRVGYIHLVGAPDQDYEDLLARVNYTLTERVNLNFEGGLEDRQFHDGPDRLFPIFDVHVDYTPFDGTLLSVSGYRNEVISYSLVGDDYLSTFIQANLRQRFLTNFFFLASAGYNLANYEGISNTAEDAQRTDNYYFANLGVEWDPREWLSVRAHVEASEDDSTFAQNSFRDRQVNIETQTQF